MSRKSACIGKTIRRLRLAREMTQGDLARKVGMARSNISNVENGYQNLSVPRLRHVARVLGCSLDELVSPNPDIDVIARRRPGRGVPIPNAAGEGAGAGDFPDFCEAMRVTPEERRQLVEYLAMYRFRRTLEVLSGS